jgi:hypothetical protein
MSRRSRTTTTVGATEYVYDACALFLHMTAGFGDFGFQGFSNAGNVRRAAEPCFHCLRAGVNGRLPWGVFAHGQSKAGGGSALDVGRQWRRLTLA